MSGSHDPLCVSVNVLAHLAMCVASVNIMTPQFRSRRVTSRPLIEYAHRRGQTSVLTQLSSAEIREMAAEKKAANQPKLSRFSFRQV